MVGTRILFDMAITGTPLQLADYLISGYWQSVGAVPHHWAGPTVTYNLGNLNATEQSLAVAALKAWEDVSGLTFVSTSGLANINFSHNGNMQAYSNTSWDGSGLMTAAVVNISSDWVTSNGGANDGATGLFSYAYQTYLHEIGHALGLGHQGPYNGSATYGKDNIFTNDTWQYSLMSYFDQDNLSGSSTSYAVTPQMADIVAIQALYGAAATKTGDTVYGFNSNAGPAYDFANLLGSHPQGMTAPALTIYDSGGNDTLDCSLFNQDQFIFLDPGAFSSVGGEANNIGIFSTTVIENALGGSGNDTINGNAAANYFFGADGADSLYGGAGADELNGGDGADTLAGGAGNDVCYVNQASDVTIENPDSGTDTVVTFTSWTLASTFENLTLNSCAGWINGTGNSGANVIIGNTSGNVLNGGFGNDILSAGFGVDPDFFVFDTALNAAANVDAITDFNDANDTFVLNHAVFTTLGVGTLAAKQFQIGAAANEAADRIIYNQGTGQIFYDADGDLGGTAVLFATVTPGISLTNNDFIVV
jgi:Ca2+-binding RTX toxin-like protein